MKKLLAGLALATSVALVSFQSFGDDSWVDADGNVWYYTAENENREATVWWVELSDRTVLDGMVTVPAKINDFPVTVIGPDAFFYGYELRIVYLPEGLKVIDDYAFYGNERLSNIKIPSSVEYIGASAFEKCVSLDHIVLQEGLLSIGDLAFKGCSALDARGFTIPNSVKHIGKEAFIDTAFYNSCRDNAVVVKDGCALCWKGSEPIHARVMLNGYRLIADSVFAGQSQLGTLVIGRGLNYIGAYAFADCTSLAQIFSDEDGCPIPSHVLDIGDGAFSGCSSLKAVSISPNITEVKPHVFENCSSLAEITIPCGMRTIGESAFGGCTSLLQINFESPSSLTGIENAAFQGCVGLTSVIFPESVDRIGEEAFRDCENLESVTLPQSVSVGKDAFAGCPLKKIDNWNLDMALAFPDAHTLEQVTFAPGVTEIPAHAFERSQLADVVIPDGVEDIGEGAFKDCGVLTHVHIPHSVTKICPEAFSGCSSLADIVIPNGVVEIGEAAFKDCAGLESVEVVGKTLKRIGDEAFAGCTNLTTINIPESIVEIGTDAFRGCMNLKKVIGWTPDFGKISGEIEDVVINPNVTVVPKDAFADCKNLKCVMIPSGVKSLDENVFNGCTALETVVFEQPATLKNIGDGAFRRCLVLTEIDIPYGVTNVGMHAFSECELLPSIVLPTTVESVGEDAFQYCSSLQAITIPPSVTLIGNDAFHYCTNLTTIYVQRGDKGRVKAMVEATQKMLPKLGTVQYVEIDIPVEPLPVEPGTKGNPWPVGADDAANVTAYVKDGTLYLGGSGMLQNFSVSSPAPWADRADEIGRVVVTSGVKLESGALAELDPQTELSLATVGQLPPPTSVAAGRLAANASFIAVDPATQTARIGISVKQSDTLPEQSGGATLMKSGASSAWHDVRCGTPTLDADGSTVIIPVPAAGKSGFYLIQAH